MRQPHCAALTGARAAPQGQEQIEQVEQASMNSGKPEDSFARLNFHPGASTHHALPR